MLPDVEAVVGRIDNVGRLKEPRRVELGDNIPDHVVNPREHLKAGDVEGVVGVDLGLVLLREGGDPGAAAVMKINSEAGHSESRI